jgi:hypothetical protein
MSMLGVGESNTWFMVVIWKSTWSSIIRRIRSTTICDSFGSGCCSDVNYGVIASKAKFSLRIFSGDAATKVPLFAAAEFSKFAAAS